MTDEHTDGQPPDQGSEAGDSPSTGDAASSSPATSRTSSTSSMSNREWIIPVSVLGGLLVAALVFVAGFGVGRATAEDDDAYEADHAVVVPTNPGDRGPRDGGYGFGDFGRRGPRFDGDLDELREMALDRACTLLEEGAIPDRAPFLDRLTELCDARGA